MLLFWVRSCEEITGEEGTELSMILYHCDLQQMSKFIQSVMGHLKGR